VHERRRLQGVIATLAPQIRDGPLSKLRMDERNEILSRPKIAEAPGLQQLADGPCGCHFRSEESRVPHLRQPVIAPYPVVIGRL
jgi:hypothetical protein